MTETAREVLVPTVSTWCDLSLAAAGVSVVGGWTVVGPVGALTGVLLTLTAWLLDSVGRMDP